MSTDILVVDDSAAERIWIGHFLRKCSEFKVRFASSGPEALKQVAAVRPAVIVSDLHMPGMSGLDLIQELNFVGDDIPVVLMTSAGSEDIAVKALRAGAASYVPKRVMDTELFRTLRNVLAVTVRRTNRRRHLENMTLLESHSVLESDDASLSNLISYVLDHVVQMKLLWGQEVTQVGIALQEALASAVYQGNLELDPKLRQNDEGAYFRLAEERRLQAPYAGRQVFVEIKLDRSALRFVVTHEGNRCDLITDHHDSKTCNMDRIHGRSLTLINSFMDSVSHQSKLNRLTMIKNVKGRVADQEAMLSSNANMNENWNPKCIVETQPANAGQYLASLQ